MIWVPFLHWYQPPNQTREIILKVIKESYDPAISLLERYLNARITLNVNGCLTEQIVAIQPALLERIKTLVLAGQIELAASAKYHPLLPLLPKSEIERQINLNIETNRHYFGDIYKPLGFFPPELAFSNELAEVASRMGFKWIILDEISLDGSLENEGCAKIYQHKNFPNLTLFFSDRQISHTIRSTDKLEASSFWSEVKGKIQKSQYLITANDGETFGHHFKHREEILEFAFEDHEIQLFTLSQIKRKFAKKLQSIIPQAGTWETTEENIKQKNPFPLWKDPKNKIHKLQWLLTEIAIHAVEQVEKPEDDSGLVYASSRNHLDRGLHSCHFWWASAYPWWNPDIIIEGSTELIRSIRSLPELPASIKQKAEKIYAEISKTTWQWHWGDVAQKKIKKYDSLYRSKVV